MQHILIVDDVFVNRKLIRKIIENAKLGVEIHEATNGVEAIEMVKKQAYCVIILDIMMPDIDGLQVLAQIKAMPDRKDTGIIMCSADQQIESVEQALAMGALDYFIKPLTIEQIRITLPLKIKNAVDYYIQKRLVVEYNERFKEELHLAEVLQKSLIKENSQFGDVSIHGKYIPCTKIGGDLFSARQNGDKIWFMISDISGHGIASAMMSSMMKVIFNAGVTDCNLPNEMLELINSTLSDMFEGAQPPLITAFVGFIEGDDLYYSNAGHPYPIIYRSQTDQTEELNQAGFLLGLFKDTIYTTQQSAMYKGDVIVLYTDGLYDHGKAYEVKMDMNVVTYCELHKSRMKNQIRSFIEQMAIDFEKQHEEGFDDDVAVMCIIK